MLNNTQTKEWNIMKKAVALLITVGLTLTATPSFASDPVAPARLKMPAQSKYFEHKGMDCWKYWRVTKCLPK